MLFLGQQSGQPDVWIGNGVIRVTVNNGAELAHFQRHITATGGDPTVYVYGQGSLADLSIDVIGKPIPQPVVTVSTTGTPR